jgi:hypothetical protein
MRRRVSGATSARPFMTFETVGTDTPASRAISAIVVPLAALRREICVAIRAQCNHAEAFAKLSGANGPSCPPVAAFSMGRNGVDYGYSHE